MLLRRFQLLLQTITFGLCLIQLLLTCLLISDRFLQFPRQTVVTGVCFSILLENLTSWHSRLL